MADDTRTLLAQTNTYSDDAVILRQEANKFIGEDITVTIETNRAIVEGSAGGSGIVNSFYALEKEDSAYQPYAVLDIPFVEQSNMVTLREDTRGLVINKAGTYNIIAISTPSGNGSTQSTITLYKNDEVIDTFTSNNQPSNTVHIYSLDLSEDDEIRVYNGSTGWTTLTTILFFRG